MKRIHAFGCSLTAQHGWFGLHSDSSMTYNSYKASADGTFGFVDEETGQHIEKIKTGREAGHWSDEELDVTNYAISGGATNMQLVQYGNGVADGSIDKDDIIIWQITSFGRVGVFWDKWLDKNTVPLSGNGNVREYGVLQTNHAYVELKGSPYRMNMVNVNLGDNEKTPIPREYQDNVGHSGRNLDRIYDNLWSVNGIAKRNPKTLVVYGWESAFEFSGYNIKPKFDDFFIDNEIEFIEEPILEYAIRMGHAQNDTFHPHWHGYKAFTDEVLAVKLKQLGWI